ncbi:MAG TPA: helix-turn-helix domain-containing protein [Kiloniellales bacterium]|jgi:TetR/AcrR family transcriptional repressor for divergent bdcA|nr:helix-turn-helix domain-containing protein [Kiloniellales bacterium]
MSDTKKARRRGRPRQFDPEEAVARAQHLFHARGYDAVSVAEVTDSLGIKAPSFYAAFGNKGGLYRRVLDRYTTTRGIPFDVILSSDRPVAEALEALLEEAAHRYAEDAEAAGCLVLESLRCNDQEAREAAYALHRAAEEMIRDYIAARHPKEAERVTDFVSTVMAGMSAKAREGYGTERLLAVAALAGAAIARDLHAEA